MPSAAPAHPFPVELLLSIRLSTWKSLFDAYGYPASLDPSAFACSAGSHVDVVRALAAHDLPLRLRRALFTLLAFAAESARVDVYSAAHALGHAVPWADASSPCDLAALLVAAAAHDASAREILDAARVLRDRVFRPIATQIYVGAAGPEPDVGEPTQYDERWKRGLSEWCARRGFGAAVRVATQAWKRIVTFELAYEDRLATYVVCDEASGELAPRVVRPVRSVALVYDATSRGLAVVTDSMEAMTPLASLAGAVLFGDARHFLSAAAVDLWTLQERGRDALSVPPLAEQLAMSAVGGTWHSGKDHAVTPRGRDFFEALARYKIRIEGGHLDFVTVRGKVPSNDEGPAQCDVALRPPHLCTVSEPELAPLLRDALDRASITRPVVRVRDFYSLQPWLDPSTVWVAFEGEAGFAALVERGILRADPTNRAVAPPEQPYAGRTATAYALPSGKLLAWSPDPTIAPFLTREEDLVVYALSFERLAATIAEELTLEGAAAALDDDGVLFCGRRPLGPTYVLVFLPTRPIRPATVERLREAAGHGHALLIVPEGRFEKHGLRQVAMPKLAGPWRPLLAAMVRALKLEPIVDTTLYAPADARIVLHRATGRVWLDGIACTKVTEMSFKLLDFLVAQNEVPVHTRDIAIHLRGRHWHEDTTRKAIEGLMHALEASFKAQKKKPPEDLHALLGKPKHGHYVLRVRAFAD